MTNMHHHNNHNNPMNPKNHSSDNFHAQAILTAYYDHQYPIVWETEDGLQYRSKLESLDTFKLQKSLILINPNLIEDECKIEVIMNEQLANASIQIIGTDGKILKELAIKELINQLNINSKEWPRNLFIVNLINNGKIICSAKGIKK